MKGGVKGGEGRRAGEKREMDPNIHSNAVLMVNAEKQIRNAITIYDLVLLSHVHRPFYDPHACNKCNPFIVESNSTSNVTLVISAV